jgi:hypothetical protein
MKATQLVGVLALGLMPAGCATLINGSTQDITVNSNVEGAEVHLNDEMLGTTPLFVTIRRGEEGLLSVTAEGYQPYRIALNKKLNWAVFGNLLSTYAGFFGSSTDYSTGAMYMYEPSTFFASLHPAGQQSTAQETKWQLRERLRAFVLINHQAIVSDLATGHGEHVDVLFKVCSIERERRADALERWRSSYLASRTVLEFAGMILDDLR